MKHFNVVIPVLILIELKGDLGVDFKGQIIQVLSGTKEH